MSDFYDNQEIRPTEQREAEIFSLLGETESGYGGEIQLTDALLKLSGQRGMYAYEF